MPTLPPFEFENWAVIALGGIPNKVQVGDMGLDARIFPVGTQPADKGSMFADDWTRSWPSSATSCARRSEKGEGA
jgi:hypothetical protein